MTEADKMFEKLGYELENDNYIYLSYIEDIYTRIQFNKERKTFLKEFDGDVDYISIQELQAINAKVKELGWNE